MCDVPALGSARRHAAVLLRGVSPFLRPGSLGSPESREGRPVRKRCICGKVDCQRHGSSGWAGYKRRHPERAAFYASSTWRVMRDRHLKANPDCVVCGKKASHADHVLAIANGGTTDSPLQSMCRRFHLQKTVKDSHQAAKLAAARGR